ncbi:glutathione S-transferase-like isoform X2 [Haemorhous mexicanus]|uniref:glutathione S-transferase-like isoform X2 n=1 Tax=Haemorhous mexicanus TaxID=30427 RepID=UPI0028BDD51E|nr:glutathione S-transferase-like isoform X2 [Haemorhous mexicanus]XP_059698766.1 glutathione S-transferase-like isoform X2 [Haemorhous mexicanus]
MSGKPKLHYFNGRGRMEPIRWLLATAGVEFEESYLDKKEDLTKLQKDGSLLFQQVPMVEIDGMKLVQTRAILNYIATKYNLYGKDMKERALIDMYVEGMFDLNELLIMYVVQPADKKEEYFANMMDKAENRYFPVFEKSFKARLSNIPTIKKFLQPGSQRKPPTTEEDIARAIKIFRS